MNNKRILLGDDDAGMREYLEELLADAGFDVVTAVDGRSILSEILRSQAHRLPFDALITDMKMPGLNGLGVVDNLKAMEIDIPIMIITAYETEELLEALKKRGSIICVRKPFEGEGLIDKLNGVLCETANE